MQIDFDRQVIVVTGASRGIGRAIAREFAAAGASVALVGRDRAALDETARLVTDLGRPASIHVVDLGQEEQLASLVEDVLARWGHIDVLVNNAGISFSEDAIDPNAVNTWITTRRVNLDAVVTLSRTIGAGMAERGQGSIINISSVAGSVALPGHEIAYSTTKAAVDGFTRALADALAPFGVRVNGVAPGYIGTEMNAAARQNPKFTAAIEKRTPLRRFGTPSEVAYAALFLASPYAGYITGQTLFVDGGWTIR